MADPVVVISRATLSQAIVTRLTELQDVGVYTASTIPGDLPVLGDGSGRVSGYTVVWSGDGSPLDETPLCGETTGSLLWPFFVTCAHGYDTDTLWVIDRVHALLDDWAPDLLAEAGFQAGPIHPPAGYNAGPVREDRDVAPSRFYLPLAFQLTAWR